MDPTGMPSPATSTPGPAVSALMQRAAGPAANASPSGVTKLHSRILSLQPIWARVADVLAGSDAVKMQGTKYLPRSPGMEIYVDESQGSSGLVDEYAAYVQRAVFLPLAARTIPGLVGMLFSTPPTCELPELLQPQLDNITLTGQNWQALARECATELLTVGWGAVAVDVVGGGPDVARPFQRMYCGQAITNWRIQMRDGLPVLTQVVLYEEAEEPAPDGFGTVKVPQYRVLALVDDPAPHLSVQLYRQLAAADGKVRWIPFGDEIIPQRRGEPLTFIPIVPFHIGGATWDPHGPPLLQLVDHNLAHYRNSADYEHGLHFCGVPTPIAAGFPTDQKLRVGGTAAWLSSNPQAHAEYLQTGGVGLSDLRQALIDKREDMAILAARVLLGSGKRAPETADAMRIAATSDDATLSHVALALQQALRQAAIWHVWWAGTGELADAEAVTEVMFATEFVDAMLSADEAVKLMALVQEGNLSWDSFFYNLSRGGRVPPTRTAEQEQELIAADRARTPAPPSITPADALPDGADGGTVEAILQAMMNGRQRPAA